MRVLGSCACHVWCVTRTCVRVPRARAGSVRAECMRVPAHAALGAPRALLRAGVERVIVWLGVGVDTERLHREVHMRLRRVTAPVLPQSPHGHRPKAPMQPPCEGGVGGACKGPVPVRHVRRGRCLSSTRRRQHVRGRDQRHVRRS
jgi:hypothetical protein